MARDARWRFIADYRWVTYDYMCQSSDALARGGAGGEHSLGGGRASLRWLLRIDRHYIGTNGQNLMTHAGFFCYRAKRIGH
jgi:hypothetical protein